MRIRSGIRIAALPDAMCWRVAEPPLSRNQIHNVENTHYPPQAPGVLSSPPFPPPRSPLCACGQIPTQERGALFRRVRGFARASVRVICEMQMNKQIMGVPTGLTVSLNRWCWWVAPGLQEEPIAREAELLKATAECKRH